MMTQRPALRAHGHRRLIILGSTGSIGTATLEVVRHVRTQGVNFEVVGLAAGNNASQLADQAASIPNGTGEPLHLALADSAASQALRLGPAQRPCVVHTGPDAAANLIQSVARPGDLVVAAIVGSAGLPAALAAIDRGCNLALANKETLVAAGEIVMRRVRQAGVRILPIDSEHSAIFQCIASDNGHHNGADGCHDRVRRVVVTASGGPFRTWTADQMRLATPAEAMAHPTWDMGPKVTIDSATMMNKALEVIEAHWLFGLAPDQIDVIVHPQSCVHSLVEFVDGSVVAQLSPPDMRMPIQYALTWPERLDGCARHVNWVELTRLDFHVPDVDRFPAIELAYEVIRRGGCAGAVLNAANEAAVDAFLAGRIGFLDIVRIVADVLDDVEPSSIETMDDVLAADRRARAAAQSRISHVSARSTARTTPNRPARDRQPLP